MYKRKISDKQFILDCINKEYEICGATDRHFDTFDELCEFAKKYDEEHSHSRWFYEYSFRTKEQFDQWKAYFMEHFYDWQPRRVSRCRANREFEMINLNYGFCSRYETAS